MKQIPGLQRKTMVQGFKMETEQLRELTQASVTVESEAKLRQLSNQYIQDLYRFFNLFHNKHAFTPVFNWSLSIHASRFFAQLPLSDDQKQQIAEFYFAKGYYNEAFTLYNELTGLNPDGGLFQKMGYCKQQNGDFEMALEYYLQADDLMPEQKWLTRKIAQCYKMLRDNEKALRYYRRAEELEPENRNIQLQIGHLYVQEKRYQEALNYYFKVELATSSPKVWRAIAWCSFLSGKLKQAENYYSKMIEQHPSRLDFLNAGHVAWAQQKRNEALQLYVKSVQLFQQDGEDFYEAFDGDLAQLHETGIAADEIPLMLDKLRYMG
jgi:tetratricopeptide (TPR) repeat protein